MSAISNACRSSGSVSMRMSPFWVRYDESANTRLKSSLMAMVMATAPRAAFFWGEEHLQQLAPCFDCAILAFTLQLAGQAASSSRQPVVG